MKRQKLIRLGGTVVLVLALVMLLAALAYGQTAQLPIFDTSTKTVSSPFAVAGDTLTVTITISNTGAGDANPAYVVDALPPGLHYVSGSATGGAMYNSAENYILWTGTVAANSAVTFQYQVTSSLAVDEYATNWATVGTNLQGSVVLTGSVILTGTGSIVTGTMQVPPFIFGTSVLGVQGPTAPLWVDVSPTQGGVITTPNGITITIPAGALNDDYRIVYNPIPTMPITLPTGLEFGQFYFGLHVLRNGVIIDPPPLLNNPPGIDIDINYGPTLGSLQFPSNQKLLEDTLALYYWDGNTWSTSGITTTVSTNTDRLTAHLRHLSQFGLFGQPPYRLYLPIVMKNATP